MPQIRHEGDVLLAAREDGRPHAVLVVAASWQFPLFDHLRSRGADATGS